MTAISARHSATILLAAVAALAGASSARAATNSWTGSVNGTWDTSTANWTGTTFTSGNDAYFSGTPTNSVTTATGLTVGAITLNSTWTGTVSLTGANTVNGATTIGGGKLRITGSGGLGTSAASISAVSGAQLQLGNGVTASNSLTIGGGGVTAQGALYVPSGTAAWSGPISITGAAQAGAHFASADSTSVLNISGSITSSGTITIRNGIVAISGTQNYAAGTTLGNAGAMVQFRQTASMPASGTVSVVSGVTLAVNAGGTGEFSSGTAAGTIGGLLGGIGGQGAAVTMPAGSSLAIDTTNAAGGSFTSSSVFSSANSVGLLKLGTGELVLTNGGTFSGGGYGGYPLTVRTGTLRFDGGTFNAAGETVVGGTFAYAAGGTGYDATMVVDSGTFNTTGYLSVGRGNGVGGVSSNLTLNNSAVATAANISAGFNGGSGLNLPKGVITLNNASSLTVTGNGVFNLAESAGSDMTLALNGTSQFVSAGTGAKLIGQGGRGTMTVNDSAFASFGGSGTSVTIGYRTGTGSLTVTGGTLSVAGELRVGGSDISGTASNGTGVFNMTGGTATVGSLTLARGNNNQNTVAGSGTISGGVLTSTGDVVLGNAGNANLGKLVIAGGTFNVGPAATKWLQIGVWDTAKGQLDVSSGVVNLMNNTSIKMNRQNTTGPNVVNQTGGQVRFTSDAGSTLGGTGDLDLQQTGAAGSSNTYNLVGGTLSVPRILSTGTTGTRVFNFNGGTLQAVATGTILSLGTGTATANVRNGGAIVDTNGFAATVASPLFHSTIGGDAATDGGLVKAGAGTLILVSNNTYNGPTAVNAGTLSFTGGLASNVTVANGATLAASGTSTGSLTLTAGASLTPSTSGGVMAFNGVAVSGSTTLTLSGSIVNGTPYNLVRYGAGGITGTSNFHSPYRITLTDDTLNQTLQGTVSVESLTWLGGAGTWENGQATNWGGGQLFYAGDTTTFDGSTPTSVVTVTGTVLPNAVVASGTGSTTFTGSGAIGGSATVTKSGDGTLTIDSANSYSGGTTLNGGLLNVNGAVALGTGTVTIAGGTLGNSSGSLVTLTANNPQMWSGDPTFAGPDNLTMGNGRVTLGGSGTRTITVSTGTLTVGGITGTSVSGTIGLTKAGPGTLSLNPTAITGVVGSTVGDLTVSDGTLNMGALDLLTTGLAGSGTIANGSNTTRWLFAAVTGTRTFDGSLQDGGGTGRLGLNVSGAGTQIINGTGSWSDTTTVNGAATKLVLNGVNSGTTYTDVFNGGTLQFGNVAALPAGDRINLNGAQTATVIYATDGGDNAYAYSGSSNSTLNIVLDRATGGTSVTHPMSTPGLGVAGLGGGTFAVNVSRGANVSGTATAAFDQFNLGGGSGGSTTINPDTGTIVTVGSVTKALNAAAQTLGLGGVTTGNAVTGVISNGVATVSVVKSNASTWTLSGNSTYTGTTAVFGGILAVNGDNSAATGAVTVSNASLRGNGRLGGAFTVLTNGILIPGNSIGTLSGTQSVSFTDGSTYGYEINSASVTADLLNVGTDLNLSGTVTLSLSDLSSSTLIPESTVLSLVNYGGAWNGGLFTYSGTSLADEALFTFGANQFRIDYNSTTQGSNVTSPVGANYVNLIVVPEPTTAAALLSSLGLAGLMLRRRRS